MPSSKLREVTTPTSAGQEIAVNSRDTFTPGETMTGKRSTRAHNPPRQARSNGSGRPRRNVNSSSREDSESSTSDEEATSDEDFDEDDQDTYGEAPPPSKQRHTFLSTTGNAATTTKAIQLKTSGDPASTVASTPGDASKTKRERRGEPEDNKEEDEEDEALSELESDGQGRAPNDLDIDAEGEEDAEGIEDLDEDEDLDSDDEMDHSRAGTPYVQTKRQRGQEQGGLLALPMEPQIKKVLTADEHRMRRQEMARRRKNLSEKRNEEEKVGYFIFGGDRYCITSTSYFSFFYICALTALFF